MPYVQPVSTLPDGPPRGRAGTATLWALQVTGAGFFLMFGFGKLTGQPEMIELFHAIGAGQWFRYLTGAIQVGGALLLLVPSLAGVGALTLVGVMAGAVLTHLLVIGGSFTLPLVLLLLMAIVAWGRRDRTLKLLDR